MDQCGEFLPRPVEFALTFEFVAHRVTQFQQHLDVQCGVVQPGSRQRADRPVGGAVPLFQAEAEHPLHQRTEADLGEPGQSTGELGVEQSAGLQPDLGQAGQVLGGGMQHPLGSRQRRL